MKNAEGAMGGKCQLTSLSWTEVFEDEYTLVEHELRQLLFSIFHAQARRL